MNNSVFWMLSLLVIAILALTVAIPAQEANAQGECDDPLGCVVVAPGDPIKLASALVISGANVSLGTDSQRGVEIAIADRGPEVPPETFDHLFEAFFTTK